MNIARILSSQAEARPDAVAIIETRNGVDCATRYAEMEERVKRAAGQLRRMGLREGSTALIFHPMSLELYVTLLALFRRGCTAMFLDPSAGRRHIEQCCAIRPPDALIAGAKAHALRLISAGLRRIPIKISLDWPIPFTRRLSHGRSAEDDMVDCAHDTPALITFTSGSTGQPKAAVRTHGFLQLQGQVLERSLGLRAGQVDLTTMPIFLLANLASGVTSVIPDCNLRKVGQIKPGPVLDQIRRCRPQTTVASPAFLDRLFEAAIDGGIELPFQRIFTGGAPVFPPTLRRMHQAAPQADGVVVYGSTEAEPISKISCSAISPEDWPAMTRGAGLLVGAPDPALHLAILRHQWGQKVGPYAADQFRSECLNASEPGEIVVSGDHVLKGYLHGRGDEETKFEVDGVRWHRTGDSGYLDDQGRLWLLGRAAARISDSLGTLYPFAVEVAAVSCPGVRKAALLNVNASRLLALEPDKGKSMDMEDLKKSLQWAMIDEFRLVRAIPMDKRHNAKVDYTKLDSILKR